MPETPRRGAFGNDTFTDWTNESTSFNVFCVFSFSISALHLFIVSDCSVLDVLDVLDVLVSSGEGNALTFFLWFPADEPQHA